MMTAQGLDSIRASYAALAPHSDELAERFFGRRYAAPFAGAIA